MRNFKRIVALASVFTLATAINIFSKGDCFEW